MKPRLRGIPLEALKILVKVSIAACLFFLLENQLAGIRRDLHGKASGLAEAQARSAQELRETQKRVDSALRDSDLQFARARQVFQDHTDLLEGERRELARFIEDRTGAIATNLNDRLESERNLLEGARARAETNAALLQKLEQALDHDVLRMKRRMIYPTVQLRGHGTVGSGVLVYSRAQGGREKEKEKAKDSPGATISFILTAHHVVQEVTGGAGALGTVEEIRILGEDDVFDPEVFSADPVLYDRDRDIALLRLRSSRTFRSVAELAPRETIRDLDIFTRAYAVGCPLGNRPLPTVGELSSKSKVVGDQVFWMLNAPTFFGNSGGGVYLASTCQLIGISSMIYTYGRESPTVVPHLGLFISLESISDWLESEGYAFLLHKEPIPEALLARYGRASLAGGAERPAAEPHSAEEREAISPESP